MDKNIVFIQTEENIGTGILYLCRFDEKYTELKDFNSFIVFTSGHVLENFCNNVGARTDIKDYVNLKIFDNNGIVVSEKDIKQVFVHYVGSNIKKSDDIGALLVCISSNIQITPNMNLFEHELINRDVLFMEGYPGVMLEDIVSQKMQLKGVSKNTFPINNKLGIYQITDDYHWYNDINDLKLMEGFSGSPIYIERDNETFLIGMSQSVSNIANGENPFKLVYYLKIKYVIERLREENCIIFRKKSDGSYIIEWIKDLEIEFNKFKYTPSLLLIGSSGAGKSSFAKDFAYNSNKLDVTNDGQTTRTNIVYNYKIFCDEPSISVKFLRKDTFGEHLEKLNGAKPIIFIFSTIFGMTYDALLVNDLTYIKNFYTILKSIISDGKCKLNLIDKNYYEKFINTIEDLLFYDSVKDNEKIDLVEIYEGIIFVLLMYIDINIYKFICDKIKLDRIKEDWQEFIAFNGVYVENSDYEKHKSDFIKISLKYYDKFNTLNTELANFIFTYCNNGYQSFGQFQEDVLCRLEGENAEINYSFENANFKLKKVRNELFDIMFNIEGFFNISELSFLFGGDNEIKNKLVEKEDFTRFNIKIVNGTLEMDLVKNINKIYDDVYDLIKEKLVLNEIIAENKNSFTKKLSSLTSSERLLITRCLQLKDKYSLTGLITSVKIEDRISNEYALLLKDLKVKELKILDTCGLDHVERNGNIKSVLRDNIDNYEINEGVKFKDFSILYLKKLDSGKPDELRNIIPIVYDVIPQAPLYCVFTGIDIFYNNNINKVKQISWKQSSYEDCPKSVQYVISEKGKKDLIQNIKSSERRKENLYCVLKNNLIPYCGQKDIVSTNFNYYENNIKYISKLLSSIIQKEYSSLEIFDRQHAIDTLEKLDKKIEMILKKIFEYASIRNWSYHYMTIKANYRRISSEEDYINELGYSGTYRHRWYQLFYESYIKVINAESQGFAEDFEDGQGVAEAVLVDMISLFLGSKINLLYREIIDKENKEFRIILEKFYKLEEGKDRIYASNPFEDDNNAKENDHSSRKKYLEDVCDFAKGYNHSEDIRNELIEHFKKCFIKQLDSHNKLKAKSLVEVDLDFAKNLKLLEDNFKERFNISHGVEADKMFNMIMKYYFEL